MLPAAGREHSRRLTSPDPEDAGGEGVVDRDVGRQAEHDQYLQHVRMPKDDEQYIRERAKDLAANLRLALTENDLG